VAQDDANSSAASRTLYYGPFRFESQIEIPELNNVKGSGERLVHIGSGGVPEAIQAADFSNAAVQLSAAEYLLNIPRVARYYVADGNRVQVESVPGVPPSDISAFLLGSVFGALCHQNRLLPLHASAIAQGEQVTAFLGDSGSGKSTLAASLNQRGYSVVSDDICLVDPSDAVNPRVIPVAGWLKLWNQSLEHLGQAPDERLRVFSKEDKYRVPLPPAGNEARRLVRLVFLDREEEQDAAPTLTRLSIPEAVAALMDMTYAVYIPVLSGQQPRLFRECAGLLAHAEAFRLRRPWSLSRSDEVLDLLERELLGR